ncbi:hypothetical protein FA15DRAFT_710520 [Coprinopsis marcescibilis]|uniref:Uncharacterized protein n=1 Tax=Coprinopsis marcescibilis TaxID=230819 RepID=A0A5C3KDK2_COPMA|nr:hypothetical protein FA15DRAFT_710520 [Coprinopsis marcescibilis]
MSIDSPLSWLHILRDVSVPDVVMEGSQGSSFFRENSLPANALTSRPSFRMRTSLTPQPQRKVSEPPALSNLVLNPTFIRPPPVQCQESQPPPTTTSGSFVETVGSGSFVMHSPVICTSLEVYNIYVYHIKLTRLNAAQLRKVTRIAVVEDQLDAIEKEKIGKLVYELG